MDIQKRRLGKTGVDTTILGLGGEGVLRKFVHEKEADAMISAIDLGITYFESARAYSGSESYYGTAHKGRRKWRGLPLTKNLGLLRSVSYNDLTTRERRRT